MPTPSHVQVPPNSTGPRVETDLQDYGGGITRERQQVRAVEGSKDLASAAALQAIPTSLTALIVATCEVHRVVVANPTASGIAITITDAQGTPVALLSSFVVPGNSFLNLDLGGLRMLSGLKWQAGGAGLTGAVLAY